jgi:hypothetical protein
MGHGTGVLGGSINDMQLLDTIAAVPSLCSYVGTVGPILAAQSDLEPGVVTLPDGGMPTRCAAISIGISLSGVAATKGTVVTAPAMDGGTAMGCMDGGVQDMGGGPG